MFTRFRTFQKTLNHSRTPLSWLKITVFYLIFLACFWIACLFIFFEVCQKISSWFPSKFLVDSGFWCFQNAELIAPSDPSWRRVWWLGTHWNKPRGKISLVISNDSRKKHDVLWVGGEKRKALDNANNVNIAKISKWPPSGICVQQTAQIGRSLLQGGGVGIKEQDWFKLRFKRGNDKLEIKIDLNFWTMHIMFRQARRLSLLAKKYNYNSVVLR